MKLKYFQESLGCKIGPPIDERLRRGRLKDPCDLLKWKTSVFKYSTIRLNFERRFNIILYIIITEEM